MTSHKRQIGRSSDPVPTSQDVRFLAVSGEEENHEHIPTRSAI